MKRLITSLFALPLVLAMAMSCDRNEIAEEESVVIEGLQDAIQFAAVPTGDVTFSITSNVKSDKTLVVVKNGDEKIETGLKKFGAMLGDFVEVGCNSVLNPGTIVGRNTNIYPTSCVRGVVAADSIWKTGGTVVKKENR